MGYRGGGNNGISLHKLCSVNKSECVNKVDYFSNQGLKVIDFTSAGFYTIVRVEDNIKSQSLYLLVHNDYDDDCRMDYEEFEPWIKNIEKKHEVIFPRCLYKMKHSNDVSKIK